MPAKKKTAKPADDKKKPDLCQSAHGPQHRWEAVGVGIYECKNCFLTRVTAIRK